MKTRKPLWPALLGAALVALRAAPAAATPDLSGVWLLSAQISALKTSDGKAPPLRPEARAVYEQHRASAGKGDYSFDGMVRCLPPGLPRLMLVHEPFEILQKPRVMYFVHQLNRLPRRAYFGESLPTDPDPHYLGYSVARWDGDTLVIESTGFDDRTLLDNAGLPHSDALHLTERYRLSADGSRLRLSFIVDDPKTFTQPWSAQVQFVKQPGRELTEEVCAATPEAQRPRG